MERLRQVREGGEGGQVLEWILGMIFLFMLSIFHSLTMFGIWKKARLRWGRRRPFQKPWWCEGKTRRKRIWIVVTVIGIGIAGYVLWQAVFVISRTVETEAEMGDAGVVLAGIEILVLGFLIPLKVYSARLTLVSRLILFNMVGISIMGAMVAVIALAGQNWEWWNLPLDFANAPYLNDRVWMIGTSF